MDRAMVCARREAGNVLQPQGREASPGDARAQRGEQAKEDCYQGARFSRRIRQAGEPCLFVYLIGLEPVKPPVY